MTDRTRLRNQISAASVFGVLWMVRVFWAPYTIGQYWSAAAAAVFLFLAGYKYLEYREKYRASPVSKRQARGDGNPTKIDLQSRSLTDDARAGSYLPCASSQDGSTARHLCAACSAQGPRLGTGLRFRRGEESSSTRRSAFRGPAA